MVNENQKKTKGKRNEHQKNERKMIGKSNQIDGE